MELWMILTAVGLAAAAAGAVAVAVWVLLRRSDRRIASYQNKLLARQIAEVENLYLTMRGWRHDYHNHLQTLKARLDMGWTAEARAYLDSLEEDLDGIRALAETGNVSVDAILNAKLSLVLKKEIELSFKAEVPQSLTDPGQPHRQRSGVLREGLGGGTVPAAVYRRVQDAAVPERHQRHRRDRPEDRRGLYFHQAGQPWPRAQAH